MLNWGDRPTGEPKREDPPEDLQALQAEVVRLRAVLEHIEAKTRIDANFGGPYNLVNAFDKIKAIHDIAKEGLK